MRRYFDFNTDAMMPQTSIMRASIRDIVAAIAFGNIVHRLVARGDETSSYCEYRRHEGLGDRQLPRRRRGRDRRSRGSRESRRTLSGRLVIGNDRGALSG